MKEFKFWAIPFSPINLYLAFISTFLAVFSMFFITEVSMFEYFIPIWFVSLAWCILFFVLFVKRVKVQFTPEGEMLVHFNGNLKYIGDKNKLEYAKGGDINDGQSRSTMEIAFNDKILKLAVFEIKGLPASKVNNQVSLLRHMVRLYALEKYKNKKKLTGDSYTYRNPDYKGASLVTGYRKEER